MADDLKFPIDYWNQQATIAENARIHFEQQWYLNILFYRGKQWAVFGPSPLTKSGVALINPKSTRKRLVFNRIMPMIRREFTKLVKEEPQFYVQPNTTDQSDIAAARTGEAISDYIAYTCGFNKARRVATWWATQTGTGFLKTYYDESKLLPVGPDGSDIGGAPAYSAPTTFHIIVPFLEVEDIEDQPWVIEQRAVDPEVIKRTYGIEVEPTTQVSTSNLETRFRSAINIKQTGTAKQCLLREIWIKPCNKYPNGYFAVWAENKTLYASEWPYQFKTFPYAVIRHIPSGGFYGISSIEGLIPMQKEYNLTKSQMSEARDLTSKPALTAVKGSVDISKVKAVPGQIIEYMPGADPPRRLVNPDMPTYIDRMVELLIRDMDDNASQFEITKGRTPPGVEAACVDAETQALTRTGWKSYHELSVGEEIYTIDRKTKLGKFSPIQELNIFPDYEGEIYRFSNLGIDAAVTHNHKWFIRERKTIRKGPDWYKKVLRRTDELRYNDAFILNCPVESGEFEYKKEYAKLLGVIISDGHFAYYDYNGRRNLCGIRIHQSLKVNWDKCEEIQELFDSLHLDYTYYERGDMAEWYIKEYHASGIRKHIPDKKINLELFLSWSPELLQELVDGLLLGDGTTNKQGQTSFYTSKYDDALAFQTICALLGKTVGIHKAWDREYYHCTIKRERNSKVVWGSLDKKISREKLLVWCPTVSTGVWLARRGEKVYATGNSAIAYLQEENNTILYHTVASIEDAVEKSGKQSLQLIQQYWDTTRIINTVSKTHVQGVIEFKGSDLKNNTDFRVVSESMAPRSRAAKQASVMELMKLGVVPPQVGLKYFQMSETDAMYDELHIDVNQATRENLRMARGEMVEVNAWDNHIVHVQEHYTYMKSQEFELLDENLRQQFILHTQKHQTIEVAENLQDDPGANAQSVPGNDPNVGSEPGLELS